MGNRRTWWRLGAVAALAMVAGCLRIDVEHLSSDALLGRNNGSEGSQLARDHIIDRLTDIGVEGAVGDPSGSSFVQPFDITLANGNRAVGTNILGVIEGTERPDEYVIVGAHYDHVIHCGIGVAGDTICNGATDNATGVAAVIAIAEHIAAYPVERSVVFAFWDAEEDGLVGSSQYVQHPVVPLADTVAYVNYDIAGANLRPSLRDTTFAIGAETGGSVLTDIVSAARAVGPSDAQMLSSIFGQFRSDYASFVDAGIPTVFYSDSTGPCYHTADDELAVVDFAKLRREIAMGRRVTRALANADVRPTFAAGAPLVTYEDVRALELTTVRAMSDAHLLTTEEQEVLAGAHAVLLGVLVDGPDEFTADDWAPVFSAVLTLVDLLTSGECDGYLAP